MSPRARLGRATARGASLPGNAAICIFSEQKNLRCLESVRIATKLRSEDLIGPNTTSILSLLKDAVSELTIETLRKFDFDCDHDPIPGHLHV